MTDWGPLLTRGPATQARIIASNTDTKQDPFQETAAHLASLAFSGRCLGDLGGVAHPVFAFFFTRGRCIEGAAVVPLAQRGGGVVTVVPSYRWG